jgi:hypothetical protein
MLNIEARAPAALRTRRRRGNWGLVLDPALHETALAREARFVGRYLVGRVPGPDVVSRYMAASRRLFPEPHPPGDAEVVAFVRRHPWTLGLLDAASGLLRPSGVLRGKVLVMAAVLETSPDFADEFLPRVLSPLGLCVRVGSAGVKAVTKAVAGLVLHLALVRRES